MSTGKPKLLASVRSVMRVRRMSLRTEQQYIAWIRRFVRYHGLRHPAELGDDEIYTHVLNRGGLGVRSPADALDLE